MQMQCEIVNAKEWVGALHAQMHARTSDVEHEHQMRVNAGERALRVRIGDVAP